MPEQISSNPDNSSEKSTPARLVEEAEEAFAARDAAGLDAAVFKLGAELGVELETPHEEALRQNQKMYDWLFEGTPYAGIDLRQEYLQGHILTLDRRQEKAAEKEGYTTVLIVPGQIPRDKVIALFNQQCAREFNPSDQQGVRFLDQAPKDRDQTEAAQNPTRPAQFYMLALRPQFNVKDAHPDTLNQTPSQLLATLQPAQEQNPKLNLQGINLPEYLFFDALTYQTQGRHLDEQGWEYLLAETVPKTGRALCALWYPDDRQVRVRSFADASSGRGGRFAAVSHSP